MKRLLTFLCLLLLFGATTAQHGDPHQAAGLEQLEYQYGLLPDVIFTDFMFFEIDESAPTTNFAGVDTVWIGGTDDLGGEQRVLFFCDISAIPDSAAIDEVTLNMLMVDEDGYAANYEMEFHSHRLMHLFSSGATWEERVPGATDTSWVTDGADNVEGRFDDSYGVTGAVDNFRTPRNDCRSDWTRPTRAGYPIAAGLDSIYSGYQQTNATGDGYMDRTSVPDHTDYIKVEDAADVDTFWVGFKITDMAKLWHTNQILNTGMIIKVVDASVDSMKFYGAAATAGKAPFLTVKYQFATSSGTSQTTTFIGAGTGTGPQ